MKINVNFAILEKILPPNHHNITVNRLIKIKRTWLLNFQVFSRHIQFSSFLFIFFTLAFMASSLPISLSPFELSLPRAHHQLFLASVSSNFCSVIHFCLLLLHDHPNCRHGSAFYKLNKKLKNIWTCILEVKLINKIFNVKIKWTTRSTTFNKPLILKAIIFFWL